jgi:CPA2 family monovalent cation:H+ antiporter-2
MLRTPSLATIDMGALVHHLGTASSDTFTVEADSPVVGKTIGDLKFRTTTGVSVIAVIRDDQADIHPGAETMIKAGDVLVLLGDPEKMAQVEQHLSSRNQQ